MGVHIRAAPRELGPKRWVGMGQPSGNLGLGWSQAQQPISGAMGLALEEILGRLSLYLFLSCSLLISLVWSRICFSSLFVERECSRS